MLDKRLDFQCLCARTILVTGGCRSGKSSSALALAGGNCGDVKDRGAQKAFIATMTGGEYARQAGFPEDPEIEERIRRHREQRGPGWLAIEEPLAPAGALHRAEDAGCGVVVLDCVTLWLSNLLFIQGEGFPSPDKRSDEWILGQVTSFAESAASSRAKVIAVTNETGLGIVPDTRMGRRFRDLQGMANSLIAERFDAVIMTVCGIPMLLKGSLRNCSV